MIDFLCAAHVNFDSVLVCVKDIEVEIVYFNLIN